MTKKEKPSLTKLPLLPLRDPELVVFPGMYCEIDAGRPFSVEAINQSREKFNSKIIIGMQNDPTVENPKATNFYPCCVEAEIKTIIDLNGNGSRLRIIVVGSKRVNLKTVNSDKLLWAGIEYVNEPKLEITEKIALSAKLVRETITEDLPMIVLDDLSEPKTSQELSLFIDKIAGQLTVSGEKRIRILSTLNLLDRLDAVIVELNNLSKQSSNTEFEAEPTPVRGQRGNLSPELKKIFKQIEEAQMPVEVLKVAKSEFDHLKVIPPGSGEYNVCFRYIENLVSLPWKKSTEDKINIEEASKILDEDHYGLEKAKQRVLEFLAIRKLKPDLKGSILCFAGSPGVGKTSIGKSIAKAIGREFVRMSLGGINDEAEIRGHRRTYVGAIPGRIIENIKKVNVKNPVFMLDEVDKLCSNFKGDPSSALLEVLDPEQNHSFVDHYLSVPFDLSHVLFICTVNELGPIAPALRDRLEIIEIPGYSPYDKLKIAQKHLVPKQRKENGIEDKEVSISPKALTRIIEEYTSEAGVRSLERECGTIMRKVAVLVASDKDPPQTVKVDMIPKYLGPPKVFSDRAVEKPEVGLSTGLAWSRYGGSILFIETSLTPGKGKVEKPTGNLGKVIQESVNAAHTWILANAEKLNVDLEALKNKDIHIHFPSGAVPKDGPSAGVAITASILSAITNRPVRNDVAMTGEISLRGRVLPIGGLKEKILAAHRAGIKHIIFPEKNKYDLDEIPVDVINDMKFTKISNVKEALDILLLDEVNEPDDSGEMNPGSEKQLINQEAS